MSAFEGDKRAEGRPAEEGVEAKGVKSGSGAKMIIREHREMSEGTVRGARQD